MRVQCQPRLPPVRQLNGDDKLLVRPGRDLREQPPRPTWDHHRSAMAGQAPSQDSGHRVNPQGRNLWTRRRGPRYDRSRCTSHMGVTGPRVLQAPRGPFWAGAFQPAMSHQLENVPERIQLN
jgi:hypothetical protein